MKNLVHLSVLFSLSVNFYSNWATAQTSSKVHIGVILDLNSTVGKVVHDCIYMALSDFYEAHHNYSTRLVLHLRDSKGDSIRAVSAAIDLLQNLEVRAIIGPETAALTNFIVDLGDRTHVPIISFSVNSLFSSLIPSPYFIQAVQNEVSQVKVISTMIQAFGWRAATLIYEDTDYGSGIIPYLTDVFQEIDISISYKSVISISATDDQILKELYKLMTMQTRVFIVHMYSTLGSRLFLKAKEVGMITRGYAWIITSRLANLIDSVDSSVLDSMQGVLGVRSYIPRSRKLDDFIFRWKTNDVKNRQTMGSGKINIFGLWAYDAAWALAVAVERTERVNSYFQRPSIDKGLTNLLTLGISPVGPKLLNEILKAEFKGLGGEFHFINGQLQPSRLQIINVNGREEKEIACWSPSNDLSGGPNLNSTKTYAFFLASLKSPVVWPGKSTEVPRGWEMPTSGKKLRIGVPVWGFKEFVNMEKNVYNNSTKFSGFCIDLFEAVVKELPYALPFEFVPFSGSYDDLIYQVYLQEYDAMIGDTTITAHRSLYVDFTLPYMDSGVAMVAPIGENERKTMWIFLKPLKADLWLTIGAFFVFMGFVVWVLEHRINDDFRGTLSQQFSTILWFSFSTIVFAHREKLVNNLSKIVTITWLFVVLILTQSYAASLSSTLTVQRLQPVLNLNGRQIGYHEGSSLGQSLQNNFGLNKSNLRSYKTSKEYAEALSRGSKHGGVDFIFDELPYIKILLAKYCSKFAIVGPTADSEGFGFVFQKGSPLVKDVSTAIIRLREASQITDMKNKWFKQNISCQYLDEPSTQYSLTLDRFRGLFLLAGVVSTSSLIIFLGSFLHEYYHMFTYAGSKVPTWQRLVDMFKYFDQKRTSSNNGVQ